MDKLITDILAVSRISRMQLDLVPVNLKKLIFEVIDQYFSLQKPQADIQVDHVPFVLGHEPLLTQIISNLLINAVKFVNKGTIPHIRIYSEVAGETATVWFQDNGIGIKEPDQQKIFGLFERTHVGNEFPGTGVGLTIVKKAVERLGGEIGLLSDGKNGSRFWIKLQSASLTEASGLSQG